MKVNGTSGLGSAGGAGGVRPAGQGQGFKLPAADALAAPVQIARAGGFSGVMNVGALLALQDVGSPLERKRRAVNRAGRVLDVLDDMKLSVLDGGITSGDLDALKSAVREQRDLTDDPGLEGVLNEIETRAAVEMAKLEQAKS